MINEQELDERLAEIPQSIWQLAELHEQYRAAAHSDAFGMGAGSALMRHAMERCRDAYHDAASRIKPDDLKALLALARHLKYLREHAHA